MDADGGNKTAPTQWGDYTNDTWWIESTAWSPDGAQIVFTARINDGRWYTHLLVIDADGSGLKRISPDECCSFGPASWSPMGSASLSTPG